MLGQESGLELIKDIGVRHPDVATLVYSYAPEAAYAERALRAGACGYVEKTGDPQPILVALRTVLDGQLHISSDLAQRMARRLRYFGRAATVTPEDILSDREMEVFERIGNACSPSEIAEQLHLSVKTIGTYRDRIREKLGLASARELRHVAAEWFRTGA